MSPSDTPNNSGAATTETAAPAPPTGSQGREAHDLGPGGTRDGAPGGAGTAPGGLPLAGRAEVRGWLRAVATGNRAAFAGMLALFGAATAAGLVGPRLLGGLVDQVQRGAATTATVDLVTVVFLAVLLTQALLRRAAHLVATVFGERLLAHARERLVSDAVRLPLDTVESAGSGELLGRATADVDKLDEGLRQAAPQILVASVLVGLTAVAMVVASPPLAAATLVMVPVLVCATRWYRPRSVPGYERVLAGWAQVHAVTHETVRGGRTVEALGPITGVDERQSARHEAALSTVAGQERRVARLWAGFLSALDAATLLPVLALLLVGGPLYQRGLVSLGELTAMLLYAWALAEPLNEVLGWMDELQVGLAALRRVLGVGLAAGVQPGRRNWQGCGPEPDGRAIQLRGVRFGYRADREVLRGIDLDIAPGQRVAVIGPSGAGKSTLARLLVGIDRPDAGSVTLGGVAVSELPLARRRREIVLVTQEQHLFTGTLRDNLSLAARHQPTPDGALWRALAAVGARDWARRLPAGLDTRVGAGGEPVPPARTQQLALARLLLADPHILVLDEATSLLDPTEAGELERSLAAVLHGRTVVAITHRPDTASSADRVLTLDAGRIVADTRPGPPGIDPASTRCPPE